MAFVVAIYLFPDPTDLDWYSVIVENKMKEETRDIDNKGNHPSRSVREVMQIEDPNIQMKFCSFQILVIKGDKKIKS